MEPKLVEKTVKFLQPTCIATICSHVDERRLGSATITFVEGAVQAELFLDAHTPEGFDVEVSPDKLNPTIDLSLTADGMFCIVWL
jgi:hypothetical protein